MAFEISTLIQTEKSETVARCSFFPSQQPLQGINRTAILKAAHERKQNAKVTRKGFFESLSEFLLIQGWRKGGLNE
ncbi:hypothetical protein [Thiomicrorhabdus cannonii]|uniref:hypothetical protein n=1 Tax=Thiomicrorhabdus cannonii TaxID=2748011 RepID=UPI0015B9BB95|nr:hypothetical protein [Thiomicrorhabdus cannonii]